MITTEPETYRRYIPLVESKDSPVRWPDPWPWEYIPHIPLGKQLFFLNLHQTEAFYGGAAGGGKSDALLMGALQYVKEPTYSAIIFRKTFADLRLGNALIDRSHQWLDDTDARWDSQQHRWIFPSGAQVAFGYLDTELNKYRYQGAEFQYIAFDELTQQWEDDYLYLFSRLRRVRNTPIPLRMRAASNPGGVGHAWVKNRFKIQLVNGIYRGTDPERPHVPAFVHDNQYLDQKSYVESLSNLDPITREQLLRGDWAVSADGRFRMSWIKRYSLNGNYVILGPDRLGKAWKIPQCRCFQTVDPAASTKEGPGDVQIWRKAPSSTCISTWLVTPDWNLLWWKCRVFRKEIPDTLHILQQGYKEDRPEFIGIESNGLGIGVFQFARRAGLPVRDLNPRSQDKLVRATDACNRMEQGKVWLPQSSLPGTAWLPEVESQLFTWTGHPHEPSDIVDTLAYAAMLVSSEAASTENPVQYSDLPTAW